MFTFAFFVNVVFAILLLGLGGVAYYANRYSLTNKSFLGFVIFCASWIVINYMAANPAETYLVQLWTNRFVLVVGALAVLLLLDFTTYLAGKHDKHKKPLRWLWALNTISWLFCLSDLVVRDVYVERDQVVNVFGAFAAVYFLPMFLACAYLLAVVTYYRRSLTGYRRQQVRTLGNAIYVGIIVIIVGNAVLPLLGIYTFVPYTPLAMAVLIISVAVSIINHRLFDIKAVTMRSIGYAMTIATLAGIYLSATYLISRLILHGNVTDKMSISPINATLSLLLAFIFQPIKHFFDRWTNQIFYRGQYDTATFVEQLGWILTSTTRLREVLERSLDKITHTLKSDGGLFIVYRDHHNDAIVGQTSLNHFSDDEYELLRRLVDLQGNKIMHVDGESSRDKSDVARLHRMLARHHVALVLPLTSVNETVGYLLLGEQMSSGYSKRDIATLEMICNELVIAIMNARSMQVVRDLNTHLEQRVEEATHELQRSNARLIELDTTKDEFLSMASHQLRTPLTSIKGYISMVLEGDAGALTDTQQKLLAEAFTSSERMVHLISDFLNVSRLQTGKFMIERTQTDLSEVIADEVEGMEQMATSHGVKITYRKPHTCPLLYVDEGKLRQVIMNFMDNAIYYSPESKKITVRLSIEDGDVVFRVIDTGMGVPLDVQKKLFTKFFRAENARKQRPDGTGIGLFLAKKIIDGHDGKLVFESTPGKGSTFGFRLPIKQLSQPPKIEVQDTQTKTA